MEPGHFSYLLDGAPAQQVKVAAERLELLAKVASKRYLEEQAPLTETIRKQAAENDLNPNQIERVCEMANIATHRGLWTKTAEKAKVSFPLADARKIISGAMSKTASVGDPEVRTSLDNDFAAPPRGLSMAGPSFEDSLGCSMEGHNGLSEIPERTQIFVHLQKKAAERQRVADRTIMAGAELETLEKQAFEAVKQAVLGGDTFRQLFVACDVAGLRKLAMEYLPQFEQRLIKDTHGEIRNRLVKLAISKAPEDLISENLGNVTVINGAHPVLVSLDTVNRKTGEIRNGLEGLLRIDDEVKIYNQKLRELS